MKHRFDPNEYKIEEIEAWPLPKKVVKIYTNKKSGKIHFIEFCDSTKGTAVGLNSVSMLNLIITHLNGRNFEGFLDKLTIKE